MIGNTTEATLEAVTRGPQPNQFQQAATAYCNRWAERRNAAGLVTGRYRPRLHPLVPHPGSGSGAIRMMTRLLAKEATLQQQHQARKLAARQEVLAALQ